VIAIVDRLMYLLCACDNTAGTSQPRRVDVTDQERQKADELISVLETAVGQIFPRDSANSSLIASMIQSLNGLRSVLGLVKPH
jgi:hypothetical protein